MNIEEQKTKWFTNVLIGYSLTSAMAFTMFLTFIVAYLHDFKVTVLINNYGEAHWEWFILCFCIMLNLLGFIGLFKLLKYERSKRET